MGSGRWGIIGFAINTERLVLDYSGKLFLECPKMTVAQRTQTGAILFEIYWATMVVYILSHADVKYLFYQLGTSRCTVRILMLQSFFLEQKRGLPMGNGSSPHVSRYQLLKGSPSVVKKCWICNGKWEMGNGKSRIQLHGPWLRFRTLQDGI